MAAGLFEPIQFFDNNGDPLNGGLVYTYEPGVGVTAPKQSYQDAALTVAHANPIVLSAFGRPPAPIWLSGETKIVITTSTGTVLMTLDNLNRDPAGTSGWATKGEGVLTKSAPYTLAEADDGKTVAATSGSWTLDALAAATLGDGYVVDFVNLGAGAVTFNPNGAETVNGVATLAFGPGDGARLVCDGSNWRALRTQNAGLTGMKNRIINGAMSIDQRFAGTAANLTTANAYVMDRWACASGSVAAGTIQAQRVATGVPGEARYALRLLRSAGTYAGVLQAVQVIETDNCHDLAGKTVTLSFRARRGSAYSGASNQMTAAIRSGTAANEGAGGLTSGTWTGFVNEASQTFDLTTTFQTFTLSATLQSGAQEVGVLLQTAALSGSGGANDHIDITDVQLELGAPTAFERRSEAAELALCQRYYQKTFPLGTVPAQNAGLAGSHIFLSGSAGATNRQAPSPWVFLTRMRTLPTAVSYNPSAANAQVRDVSFSADCTLLSLDPREWGVAFSFTGNASTTVQSTLAVHIAAAAEL